MSILYFFDSFKWLTVFDLVQVIIAIGVLSRYAVPIQMA